MPAPLYIALIRYANGTLDIRTYITSATMRADSKCVRIVVDWEERNKLQHIIRTGQDLSLIHISEPTRLGMISYAVFCLKKKKKKKQKHKKTSDI